MQLNAREVFVYGAIWTAISGAVGWLAARYGVRSDRRHADEVAKRERKNVFLGEVTRWRTEIRNCNTKQTLFDAFSKYVATFAGQFVIIERDLIGETREKFHSLCDQIIAIKDPEIDKTDYKGDLEAKDKLLGLLERIVLVLEPN